MDYGVDYYGKEGCCLTCDDETKMLNPIYDGISDAECLCPECKCRKCVHYNPNTRSCMIADKEKERWANINFEIETEDIRVETPRAILVVVDEKECWLPKSLVHTETKSGKLWIVIPTWLAEEKGLLTEEHNLSEGLVKKEELEKPRHVPQILEEMERGEWGRSKFVCDLYYFGEAISTYKSDFETITKFCDREPDLFVAKEKSWEVEGDKVERYYIAFKDHRAWGQRPVRFRLWSLDDIWQREKRRDGGGK